MTKKEKICLPLANNDDQTTYALGIEFGSTRVKASLIDAKQKVVCSASCQWESVFQDNYWTYDLTAIHTMLQKIALAIEAQIKDVLKYEPALLPNFKLDALGISAMMHGYLAFDQNMNLLTPFRTWRCTNTAQAAAKLSKRWQVNIPLRWSIAHLYQAILNGEEHITQIAYFTTLSGYIHYLITGQKVLGIGDASGMFPIDNRTKDYRADLISDFEKLVFAEHGLKLNLRQLMPQICLAGEVAGAITAKGLQNIGITDTSSLWQKGIRCCPPEGDAGTGMVATNAIAPRRANISAGTSLFAMLVLDKEIKEYEEIDRVTTPDGQPVAMVHCNNCTVDINQWVRIFQEVVELSGVQKETNWLIEQLFKKAAQSPINAANTFSCGYQAGEPLSKTTTGVPMLVQLPPYEMTLSSLMRSLIYSSLATLKLGMTILEKENVRLDHIIAHGGLFKTPQVAQKMMSIALETPTSVFKTAEEGGSWGIALLAQFMHYNTQTKLSLEHYLDDIVFSDSELITITPHKKECEEFNEYYRNFLKLLEIENKLDKMV